MDLTTIAILSAVAAVFFVLVRSRRREAVLTSPDAASPSAAIGPGARPPAAAEAASFSGHSHGLAWSAVVEAEDDDRSPDGDEVRRQRTRIQFPDVRASADRFVLVMTLPPNVKVPVDAGAGDGLLSKLAWKAAEAALDLYVAGFFGSRHRGLVGAAGAARLAAPAGFYALATDERAARALVDPEGCRALEAARQADPLLGPSGAEQFGLLLGPEGLVFAVQEALLDPARRARAVAHAARLAAHLSKSSRW